MDVKAGVERSRELKMSPPSLDSRRHESAESAGKRARRSNAKTTSRSQSYQRWPRRASSSRTGKSAPARAYWHGPPQCQSASQHRAFGLRAPSPLLDHLPGEQTRLLEGPDVHLHTVVDVRRVR